MTDDRILIEIAYKSVGDYIDIGTIIAPYIENKEASFLGRTGDGGQTLGGIASFKVSSETALVLNLSSELISLGMRVVPSIPSELKDKYRS